MVDDALLAEAQAALGTTGLRDTVDRALGEAVRAERRRDLLDQLRTGEGFDRELLGADGRRAQWRGA